MPDNVSLTPDMPGLWLSLTDLAARIGVKKQSLAEKLKKFEDQGLVTTRPGAGRTKLINVAEFDRANGSATDLIRTIAAKPEAPDLPAADHNLGREQARRVAYQAELSRLDLEERTGKLLRLDKVIESQTRIAEALIRVIDQLPSRADDIATAVARDGAQGVRALLKSVAVELRTAMAREMRNLEAAGHAEDASETEESAREAQ